MPVKRPSPARLIAASLAFSVVTLLHPYTGLTLVAAGGGVLLAFVPSSLVLSVTTYISTDIAAVPLLWVIPLALYLLTFILVFARLLIQFARLEFWPSLLPLENVNLIL